MLHSYNIIFNICYGLGPLLSELCVLSANVLFVSEVVFAGATQHQLFAKVFSSHVQEEILQLMVLEMRVPTHSLIIGKSL